MKIMYLNYLETDFCKTPIRRNVVLFEFYNFVKSHDVKFVLEIGFKFEFNSLAPVWLSDLCRLEIPKVYLFGTFTQRAS